MKKAFFIYWTGSGHTRHLVKVAATRLAKEGLWSPDFLEVNALSVPPNLESYDLIVFSYPVYAFNLPGYFWKFVKGLKLKEGGSYLIAKQSGEPISLNNASSYPLIAKIKRSGRPFLGEYHFLYPYNIHFRYPDDFVKEILNYNGVLLDILVDNLAKGAIRRFPYNPLFHFLSFLFRIQRLGSFINSRFYRIDPNKCTECHKCIRECPMGNITIKKGKIVFGHHCEMCMRCSFLCPTGAIDIGLLQGWKVNGSYPLERIKNDPSLKGEYSFSFKKGFYSWFNKPISRVEDEWNALKSGSNDEADSH